MKNLIYSLLLSLIGTALGAQSVTPEVVATTGETFSNSTVTLEWTLGEIMTETYPGSILLTQGFHQPPADVFPPIARCRENVIAQLDAEGELALDPSELNNGSSDTETAAEDLILKLDFGDTVLDCNAVGLPAQPVNLVVTDENGFLSSCTAQVSVMDTVRPVVTCRDTTIALDPLTGEASLLFLGNVALYSASDNCRNLALQVDLPTDGTAADCDDFLVGYTVIVDVLAEDASGNSASCTTTVFLSDPFGVCGETLPVEWLSFSASAGAKAVDLQWETSEETDNAGFRVERFAVGQPWAPIAQLPARTGSNQHYDFTDEAPLAGFSCYRIRQMDVDGQVSYSHIETINFFPDEAVEVYPNPATSEVNVKLPEGTELLGLQTISGRDTNTRFEGQERWLRADVSDLPSGVYFLRVRLADGTPSTRRLVVR